MRLRQCAMGEACAEAVIDPADPRTRVASWGTMALCWPDQQLLIGTFRQIPSTYEMLRAMLGTKPGGAQLRVTMTPDPAVPMRLDVEELMVLVVAQLLDWDHNLRDLLGNAQRDPKLVKLARPSVLVATISPWLANHTQVVLRTESGGTAALDVFELYARCRSKLGLTRKHQSLPVPCGYCGMRRLIRWDGRAGLADNATCEECGAEYTSADYTELVQGHYEAFGRPREARAVRLRHRIGGKTDDGLREAPRASEAHCR